jgi:hypothetical protein
MEIGWTAGARGSAEHELHLCKLPTVWITLVDNREAIEELGLVVTTV